MKKEKIIFGLIVGLLAVLGLVFVTKPKRITELDNFEKTIQPTTGPAQTVKEGVYDLGKKAGTIDWGNVVPAIETETSIYRIEARDTGEVGQELIKIFGFKKVKEKINNEDVLWITDEESQDYFYLTKTDNRLHYQKSSGQNKATVGFSEGAVTKIKSNFSQFCKLFIERIGGGKIETSNYKYLKNEGVRMVSATAHEAEAFEVEANLTIDDKLVLTSSGTSWFNADYNPQGELISFKTVLPMSGINTDKIIQQITNGDLLNLGVEKFSIFQVSENEYSSQTFLNEEIKNVKITEVVSGLIYDYNQNLLTPYVFMRGNTALSTGPTTILMGLSTIKQ